MCLLDEDSEGEMEGAAGTVALFFAFAEKYAEDADDDDSDGFMGDMVTAVE